MLLAYARISTADEKQNIDNQIQLLLENGVEKRYIYEDKSSGAIFKNREGLHNCLKALRSGDTLIVTALDRIGRKLKELLEILEDLNKRNINLKILTGTCAGLDTSTPTGKMFFQMSGMFAELERNLISERVKEGMKRAKARGVKCGRPKISNDKEILELKKIATSSKISIRALCKKINISKTTYYRRINSMMVL